MQRRAFILLLTSPLWQAFALQTRSAPVTKITRIDTIYWKGRDAAPWWPCWTWLRLHTDSGHIGLGETYSRNEAEAALIHSVVAPLLLGEDPRDIERIWSKLYRTFDVQVTGGTEMHVLSAIDLALWDLLGNTLDLPVYRLIGGKSNARVRVYNTCFPLRHDFHTEPEKIMREIEAYGIRAIKIWPFDRAAARNNHEFITQSDLDEGLAPVRKLRDQFGAGIDILMEFHGNWNLTAAIRIAKALEPYHPLWLEDMLLPGNFQQYRLLAEQTSLLLTIGERMAGRMQFQQLFESRAPRFVMFDLCWCGGLSEARKIAAMAETYQLPVAPHTAGGPLLFYASTHFSTAATNLWIQESCQRFYELDWPTMLENPIIPHDGSVTVPELPGFGMQIKPEVWKHPAAVTQTSKL